MPQVTCGECNKAYDVPATPEQIAAWHNGELIQRAMPNVSEDLRELLISGMCGACFDALFDEDER